MSSEHPPIATFPPTFQLNGMSLKELIRLDRELKVELARRKASRAEAHGYSLRGADPVESEIIGTSITAMTPLGTLEILDRHDSSEGMRLDGRFLDADVDGFEDDLMERTQDFIWELHAALTFARTRGDFIFTIMQHVEGAKDMLREVLVSTVQDE